MKKILIITPSGQIGGVEKIAYNIWKELKKNYEVKVIKIYKEKNDEIYNYEKDEIVINANKKYIDGNFIEKIYFLIKNIIFISFYKKKYNMDCSIAMGETCSIINGLTLSKDIKIGSVHGKKIINTSKMKSKIANYAYKNMKKVVCITEEIKQDIISNFKEIDSKKLRVIYNPHDGEEISIKGQDKIDFEEEKIFHKKVVLYVGRIDKNKGIIHLLKLFSMKKEELKGYNLVIIGECVNDPEYEILLKKYKDEENIYFLGFKKNPYKYMKKSFSIILPSYSEGLPNVLIESLILGTPVISTNSSEGIWEILILKYRKELYRKNLKKNYYGNVGVICPILDYEEYFNEDLSLNELKMLDAILFLEKEYDIYKKNIPKLLEKFDKDKILKQYLEIMK